MKEKELFIAALLTLFYSWGGEPPPEVCWGGNELLDWYEKEYDVKLGIRFKEDEDGQLFEDVCEAIRNT